jgi:oxygen-independent coproporphyrinogen III oxidase
VKGMVLSDDDRMRAAIIERLMCDLAVDLDDFGGAEHFAAELTTLRPLAEQDLLHVDGARIVVTEPGRPYVRIAASAFDAYLAVSKKRHSVAV